MIRRHWPWPWTTSWKTHQKIMTSKSRSEMYMKPRSGISYESMLISVQEFCNKKKFNDSQIVSENKVIWFFQEQVFQCQLCMSQYVKAQQNKQDKRIIQTLGRSFIKIYVNVLINHYNLQRLYSENSYPHFWRIKLQALLNNCMRKKAVQKKQEYVN